MEAELKEGRFIRLAGAAAPAEHRDKFYVILASEPLIYETGDTDTVEFTSVNSGSESGYKNISVLEPDDVPFHLYEVLIGFKDGCEYQVKIPNGSDRLGLDNDRDVARLDNVKSPYCAPTLRFFLIHDIYPAVNAINGTPSALTPKAFFEGWKYDLDEVKDPTMLTKLRNFLAGNSPYIPCITITLGGVRGA